MDNWQKYQQTPTTTLSDGELLEVFAMLYAVLFTAAVVLALALPAVVLRVILALTRPGNLEVMESRR